ncbi:TraB/GumN family protein [Rhizobium sp. XQZ8]|uniref:TraB/GumN family protein n=1 Tax=Rhizobium populisoli TaxID=2859785 RepID=UPI001CA50A27|nr:TraB/GumN family protein [Rhizobium populisoli]MBW6423909.1 TraB/GumN family protein [Rhizobium populisoli]
MSALLFVSSPALAQTQACSGKNLVEALKSENQPEYEQLVAQGDKVPNAKGIFWKIEKDGLDTSYLFGTMHVSDPRVLDLPESVEDARYDASVVIVESTEVLDMKKAMGRVLMQPDMMWLPDGKRLEDYLSKEDAERLAAGLKARGMVLSAVNRMRPWLISSTLAGTGCEGKRQAKGIKMLDMQIAFDAIDEDIPLEGLETFEEQFAAMNSVSTEKQVQNLLTMVTSGVQTRDFTETMIQLYEAGDFSLIWPMLTGRYASDPLVATSGISEFEDAMLIKRNHLMAERSARFLTEGGAFIAVGALHLQGEKGLVELFRKQGYTVTRAD